MREYLKTVKQKYNFMILSSFIPCGFNNTMKLFVQQATYKQGMLNNTYGE